MSQSESTIKAVVSNLCVFELSKLVFLELMKLGWEVSEVEYVPIDTPDDESQAYDRIETNPSAPITLYEGKFAFREDTVELRCNQDLVGVIERLGHKSNTERCHIQVIEIPVNVDVELERTSGRIVEKHRSWGFNPFA